MFEEEDDDDDEEEDDDEEDEEEMLMRLHGEELDETGSDVGSEYNYDTLKDALGLTSDQVSLVLVWSIAQEILQKSPNRVWVKLFLDRKPSYGTR